MVDRGIPNRLLSDHKQWADRHALIHIVFAIVLFVGFAKLFDIAGVTGSERVDMFLLLGIIVILHAIWLAAGLVASRIHEILARGRLSADSD
jgi:hypothetical protein